MTTIQLERRISDLRWWLSNNPEHPDRTTVSNDLRECERQLAERETKTV